MFVIISGLNGQNNQAPSSLPPTNPRLEIYMDQIFVFVATASWYLTGRPKAYTETKAASSANGAGKTLCPCVED